MKLTGFCMLGIILSLIGISVVSGTLIRHIVQMTPLLILFFVSWKAYSWKSFAALPVFVFWIILMLFIWLYLTRIAEIVQGHFTVVEIIFTVVIGICSFLGIVDSMKEISPKSSMVYLFLLLFTGILIIAFNYIFHIGNIFSTHRQQGEIITAVAISVLLTAAISALLRRSSAPNPLTGSLVVLVFAFMQVIVMWISFKPLFAHD